MNEEKRNVILAVSLSAMILLGWPFVRDIFFPPPPQQQIAEQTRGDGTPSQTAATGGETAGIPQPGEAAGVPDASGQTAAPVIDEAMGREEALALAPRVRISTPRVSGSINLRGARVDDLLLTDYRQTLEDDSPVIEFLQPSRGQAPYFFQFGWSAVAEVQVPDGNTVWTADREVLAPGQPVTLSWTNPDGIRFEQVISIDDDYMFSVDQRIVNDSDASVSVVPYGRIFRSGTPEVLGFYILHEGLIGVFDGVLEERDYDEVAENDGGREQFNTTGGWMGITDKYWLVALVPDQQTPVQSTFLHTGRATSQYHVNFATDALTVGPGEVAEQASRVFAGAKETTLLDAYRDDLDIANFDLAVDFGWFYFLTKPIYYAIHWLAGIDDVYGFGLAILLLTVGIKLLFFPLANKSYKSMSKMKLLQPKMVELRERCGDDKAKLQQEMMALYKQEKVNPLSGCLPILVQIPVFFALYKVLFVTIEMRHAPFFGWINDLSAPDPTGILEVFGLVPWEVPAILAILNIGLWPIIMGFTMWFQQKLNPPPADPIQQKIFGLMPIFFTFILGGFPAGLVIYWAWNNSLSILQQYVIMRRMGVAIGGGRAEEKPGE